MLQESGYHVRDVVYLVLYRLIFFTQSFSGRLLHGLGAIWVSDWEENMLYTKS